MRVETSVIVSRTTLHDGQVRDRLLQEARTRLLELGLADEAMLADEPAMAVSDGGDSDSPWATVTFSWTSPDEQD